MKLSVPNNLSRKFGKVGLKLKKHSPEIMVIGGVIGVVGSTVLACKATTKLSGILEESKENVDQIKDYVEENGYSEKYSEEDYKKDLTITYTQTAVKVAKIYAPAVVLGALSITSILAGHNITRKRNLALSAAYVAIDKSFKEYRSRVVERFGEKLDKELRYNIKQGETEEIVRNDEGGEEVVKTTTEYADPNTYSEYARFFDDGCLGWTKDPESNLTFLKQQQNYANDKLKRKGFLFLNDVYDMLGIQPTKAGQIVGWIYDEKNPIGDNFVDFGIYDINRPKNRDFVNGYERVILLDFNVDGNILEMI